MRGRTNIPNRKDPIINGDVENFVVAENNTIARGDFVSVVRNGTYRVLTDVNLIVMYKKLYDVVNKKAIIVARTENDIYYGLIIKYTSGGSEIINQVPLDNIFSTYAKFDFNIYNNILYFVNNVGTGHQSYGNVYSYAIVNDELVAQDVITLPNKPNDGIIGLAVFGTNQDIAIIHGTTALFRVYSKNSNNEYVYKLYDTDSVTNLTSNGFYFAGSGDNCVIIVGNSNQSGADGHHIVKFYNYSSSDATISKLEIVPSGMSFSDGYEAQIIGDVFYFVIDCKYSASGGSSYWFRPKVGIVDISLDNLMVKYFNEFSTINPSWYGWRIDYGDENTVIVHDISRYGTATYGYGVTGVIILTESEQGVYNAVVGEFKEINTPQDGGVAFMDGGELKIVAFTTSSSGSVSISAVGVVEYSFSVVGDEIVFGEPTNFVKSYDGKGYIGFAKTGGGAGDTVQIYVPVSST